MGKKGVYIFSPQTRHVKKNKNILGGGKMVKGGTLQIKKKAKDRRKKKN